MRSFFVLKWKLLYMSSNLGGFQINFRNISESIWFIVVIFLDCNLNVIGFKFDMFKV
jgi:hypothetical protein